MTGQHGDVARRVAVHRVKQALGVRVNAGGLAPIAEQAAAYLIDVGRILFKADGGQTAVARDERGDALPDEGLEAGQAVFANGKPVVVGVAVDESGGDGLSLQVVDLVRSFVDPGRNADDAVVFQQQVARERRIGCSVVDFGVFQKNGHRIPRFPNDGSNKCKITSLLYNNICQTPIFVFGEKKQKLSPRPERPIW